MVYGCIPRTRVAEIERSWVGSLPELHSEILSENSKKGFIECLRANLYQLPWALRTARKKSNELSEVCSMPGKRCSRTHLILGIAGHLFQFCLCELLSEHRTMSPTLTAYNTLTIQKVLTLCLVIIIQLLRTQNWEWRIPSVGNSKSLRWVSVKGDESKHRFKILYGG